MPTSLLCPTPATSWPAAWGQHTRMGTESQASWKPGSEVPGVRNPEPHRPQLIARLSGTPASKGHEGRPLWGSRDTRPTPEKGTSRARHMLPLTGEREQPQQHRPLSHTGLGSLPGPKALNRPPRRPLPELLSSGKQQALFQLGENSSVTSTAKAGHGELLHSAHPGGYGPRGHVVCWGGDYQAEYD